MSSPAEQAKAILVTKSVGVFPGSDTTAWSIRISRRSELPNAQIVLFDGPGGVANPRWLLDEPHITAMVRGEKDGYSAGYAKMREVKDALLGIEPFTVSPGGDRWDGCLAVGDIMHIGYDEQDRPLFSMEFRLYHEPADNVLTSRDPL